MSRAAIVPAVVGLVALFAGYLIARQASAPEEMAALVYVWVVPIGLLAALLSMSGYLGRDHDDLPSGAPTQALGAGLALALGTVVGLVGTPLLGLTYAPPVFYRAAGPANIDLATPTDFHPAPAVTAECESVPDRAALAQVRIDNLGELEGGRVVALVVAASSGSTGGPAGGTDTISLELGGETGRTILWHGTPRIELLGPDGRSGRVTFEGLVGEDEGLRVGPGNSPAPIDPYPATLSGTISWSCGAWQTGSGGQAR